MNSKIINLKSEILFPFQFQLFGIVLLIGGIVSIPIYPYISPFLLILAFLIFTGYQGIQFNPSAKLYRTYYSFLFLKFGKWQEYIEIKMIYINSVNVSQKIYTRITEGTTLKTVEYKAYILFNNGIKEFLTSSKHKNKLQAKLAPIAEFTGLKINDNTV
jgi:hypothetical protein